MTQLNSMAISTLESLDRRFFTDMTEPLKHGYGKALMVKGNSVLTYVNGIWEFTAENEADASDFIDYIAHNGDGHPVVCVHSEIGLKQCRTRLCKAWEATPCFVVAYFENREYPVDPSIDIRKLSRDYVDFVWKTYNVFSAEPDNHEAAGAIERGVFGIFDNNEIAGFIGTHEEGTMGMLEILPNFRKRGYGLALEEYLANQFIKAGKIPFCHVLIDNSASLALQKKMNMWISEDKVYWMGN